MCITSKALAFRMSRLSKKIEEYNESDKDCDEELEYSMEKERKELLTKYYFLRYGPNVVPLV